MTHPPEDFSLESQPNPQHDRLANSLFHFVAHSHPCYQAGWVHRVICHELERFLRQVAAGANPRLMIAMPPRHGKSFIVSERFPVWAMGHHPDYQVMVTSYNQAQANRFSRRALQLVRTPWVQEVFPALRLFPKRTAACEWETTAGGVYRATGVGGSLTGTGAHLLLMDDPIKNHVEAYSASRREHVWEWYCSTVETRLMPHAGIILIMTRWHMDDLAGRLLHHEAGRWQTLCFPALATEDEPYRRQGEALHPERFPQERLLQIQSRGGWVFQALFQQAPVAASGEIFKRQWWRFYTTPPERFDTLIQSWDMSFKDGKAHDYVVGQVWGRLGSRYYLLDQIRERLDFQATLQAVRMLSEKHPQARIKLVEDKANGPAVLSALGRELSGLVPVSPRGSKEARAMAIQPVASEGRVFFPAPQQALWVEALLTELTHFPAGAHDDQVDAMTQALQYFQGDSTSIVIGLA